jgi:hypothetical protein
MRVSSSQDASERFRLERNPRGLNRKHSFTKQGADAEQGTEVGALAKTPNLPQLLTPDKLIVRLSCQNL